MVEMKEVSRSVRRIKQKCGETCRDCFPYGRGKKEGWCDGYVIAGNEVRGDGDEGS